MNNTEQKQAGKAAHTPDLLARYLAAERALEHLYPPFLYVSGDHVAPAEAKRAEVGAEVESLRKQIESVLNAHAGLVDFAHNVVAAIEENGAEANLQNMLEDARAALAAAKV